MNKKTHQLKRFLKDNKCYYLPTCHDPLSAKLIENKGFKISFIGGFALSSAILGYPDASLITQKELVEAIEKAERRIKREKKEKEKLTKVNQALV